MAAVFISYRRDGALVHARALYERLRAELGAAEVFIDLEGIEYGVDFEEVLDRQLEGCRIMLAVVDPHWATATDRQGRRKIERAQDYLRLELVAALRRGVRVIPVLIDGAEMPDREQLPDALKAIATRQGFELDFRRFDSELGRLLAFLRKVLEAPAVQPRSPASGTPVVATSAQDPGSAPPGSAPRQPAAAFPPDAPKQESRSLDVASGETPREKAGPPQAGELQMASRAASPHEVTRAPRAPSPPSPESAAAAQPARERPGGSRRPTYWAAIGGVLAAALLAVYAASRIFGSPSRPASIQLSAARSTKVDRPSMVAISPGRFQMGSPPNEVGRSDGEGPVHSVNVAAFELAVTPVTRGQYSRFVAATGRSTKGCFAWDSNKKEPVPKSDADWRSPGFEQADDHPVVCVNWEDAQAYLQWLSKETGQAYRLPTEAEWEYAARAGTRTARFWGDDPNQACGYGNVADRTTKAKVPGAHAWTVHECDDGYAYTAPADYGKPNGYGLNGMAGNVWLWTQDCWHESYEGAPSDGRAWEQEAAVECGRRVVRGGSWGSVPRSVRSADRNRLGPSVRFDFVGFRVARTLP